MSEQKKAEEFGITEDDVSEIRQDINKFRFELVDILRKNNFDIGKVRNEGCYGGRRAKQMERRIMKVIWEKIDKKGSKKEIQWNFLLWFAGFDLTPVWFFPYKNYSWNENFF